VSALGVGAVVLLTTQNINTRAEALAAASSTQGTTTGNPITGEGLPNPAPIVTRNWGQLPAGRKWGTTAGIDVDPIDGNIWAYERCGAATAGGGPTDCDNTPLDPIFKFDRKTGAVLANFGKGVMVTPHGIAVDKQGNVWIADFAGNKAGTKGHQVHKFSPNGEKLLSLGVAGKAGNAEGEFNQPNDVVVGPDGSIYVADGHDAQGMIAASAVAEGIKRGATSHAARASVRRAGPPVGGRSRQPPHRDLRSERNVPRVALYVRPPQWPLHQGRHGLCDRLGVGPVQPPELA
jgi:hypothetical protein